MINGRRFMGVALPIVPNRRHGFRVLPLVPSFRDSATVVMLDSFGRLKEPAVLSFVSSTLRLPS